VAQMLEVDTVRANAAPAGRQAASKYRIPGSAAAHENTRNAITALLPRLTRYARVLTRDVAEADDLVQDCLTCALAKIHMWQPGTDLRAWLFTILHNQHINHLRRDKRHRTHIDLLMSDRASTFSPNQSARVEIREVERALAKLPKDQRSLILLVGLNGLRYEDAASLANIPLGTVRSRIGRGRDTLRWLTERSPDPDRRNSCASSNKTPPRQPTADLKHFRPRPTEPSSGPRSQRVAQ
jgi:RNA polymerase sigma factor (sigma-70 family)